MKSRKPELDKIKIQHLTLAERHLLPEILDLLNRTQGQGLFNTAYVEKFIDTSFLNELVSDSAQDELGRDNCKGRMFLAFENSQSETVVTKPATHDTFFEANLIGLAPVTGSVIGAAGAELISNYDYYLPFDANLKEKFAGKIVGSFATMTVHEKYQGLGIGQKLSLARLNWLKEMKADYIIGVSWVSGLKHTSDRVFEKMGFKPVKRVEGFYTDYAKTHPFDCPGCKAPACTCAAVMYLKAF